jgi:peroxiredoxin-like protein
VQDFPHHYAASASAKSDTNIRIDSPGLETLESAGPAEFGGPGDLWSPETMLVATIADCFILSFRAIARAARLEWSSLKVDAVGDLDRVGRKTQFVRFRVHAQLEIPEGTSEEKAQKLMEKADKSCLITNSLKASTHLETDIKLKAIAA